MLLRLSCHLDDCHWIMTFQMPDRQFSHRPFWPRSHDIWSDDTWLERHFETFLILLKRISWMISKIILSIFYWFKKNICFSLPLAQWPLMFKIIWAKNVLPLSPHSTHCAGSKTYLKCFQSIQNSGVLSIKLVPLTYKKILKLPIENVSLRKYCVYRIMFFLRMSCRT